MNLRKTITGAAIALGGATVMLGLGGTAHADVVGTAVETTPDLGGQLGDVASVNDLASVNTDDATGKIQAINTQDLDAKAIVENVDAGATGAPASTLLGLNEPQGPPHIDTGVGI